MKEWPDCWFLISFSEIGLQTMQLMLIVKNAIHSILVNPNFGLAGRPTNEFKQRTPRVLPKMPDRWLLTLVNTVLCWVFVGSGIFCRSVQKYRVSKRKIISFYEVTVKTYKNLIYYVTLLKNC